MRIKLTFPSLRKKNEFDEKFKGNYVFDFATVNDDGSVEAYYLKNRNKIPSKKTVSPLREKQLTLF